MSDIALYCPYVHPRDDAWLKHAALYWPRIERIVPGGYVLSDTHTGETLQNAGILIAREPQDAIAKVAESFASFVARRASELEPRYSLAATKQLPEQPPWNDEHLDLRLGWIHRGKITDNAVDRLCGTGLATACDDGFWIGMHPALSDVYMCALTAELAASGRNTPITDQALHHVAASGWTFEDLSRALLPEAHLAAAGAPDTSDAGDLLVTLALESFALRNLEDVPVERVIALREAHGEEFRRFRKQIDELVRSLSDLVDVTDPQALAHHVELRYNDYIQGDLRELRSALRRQRFDLVDTAMGISIVPPAGIIATAVADVTTVGLVTAGTTALAAWKARRTLRERRNATRAGHASSWLLRIDKDLTPHNLAGQLRRLASRFVD